MTESRDEVLMGMALVALVWTPGLLAGAYWLTTGRSPIAAVWAWLGW